MTEEEAKTKWCPFARSIPARRAKDGSIEHDGGVPAFNRYNTDEKGVTTLPGSGMCIGSACMAWRSSKPEIEYGSAVVGKDGNPLAFEPLGEGWAFTATRRWARETPSGFCGLAGHP